MKMRRMLCAGLCLAAVLMIGISGTAAAGTAVTEEKRLELAGSSVSFLAVSGMEDEALQQQVNARIQQDLRIQELLTRINALLSGSERSLTARGSALLAGDVYSGVLEAEGAVESLRNTHRWTWSNIDLRDGHEIALSELFTDEEAARTAIESYLEEQVAPELSAHLENSELTPLPEGFRLESTGLTLLYPAEQLSTLSSRAGAIRIGWNEIREWVDWSEDGIPTRIGAKEMADWTEASVTGIREMTENGTLPDIPAALGDSVKALTDRYGMLTDPDEYAEGRMFALEGGSFRNVFILSDAITGNWDESAVQGIRVERGCIRGLCIGETEQNVWRQALGEPDSTVTFDAETAETYRTVPGICDYYEFGDHLLQLYCGEDGLLVSITLTE